MVVTNVETNAERDLVTDAEGRFNVPALPVGNYSITVSKTGFNTKSLTRIQLVVGQEARLFAAHEDVLCQAPFFEKVLRGRRSLARTAAMNGTGGTDMGVWRWGVAISSPVFSRPDRGRGAGPRTNSWRRQHALADAYIMGRNGACVKQ